MLKLPEVLGVSEARSEMAHVLEEVQRGHTFIIKGTKGWESLVISADIFRRLQDAYLEVVGELETAGILNGERASKASSEEGIGRSYSLSEVGGMIEEAGDVEGPQP